MGTTTGRGAEAARLSASATSAALRVLAGQGLAERGPDGRRRGLAALAGVAESTGAADLTGKAGGPGSGCSWPRMSSADRPRTRYGKPRKGPTGEQAGLVQTALLCVVPTVVGLQAQALTVSA